MNVSWRVAGLAVAVCGTAWLGGCGEKGGGAFVLSYDQPARVEIPAKIRTLAVQPEEGRKSDARWGPVAADKMIDLLKESNAQTRYALVERSALRKMLEEQDLQTAFGDPDAASQHIGKLKTIDGIVYIHTQVSTEQRAASRTKVGRSGPTSEGYTRYFATVTMSFKLVDLGTGSTLAAQAPKALSYDSDRDDKRNSIGKMVLGGSGDAPATDVIVDALIDRGVRDFVATISPHTVRVEVPLASGKNPAVKAGNVLALSGDYDGALDQYHVALDQNDKDHGAAFNAGLMYEAKGDFAAARKMYAKAVGLNKDTRYAAALERVRR